MNEQCGFNNSDSGSKHCNGKSRVKLEDRNKIVFDKKQFIAFIVMVLCCAV